MNMKAVEINRAVEVDAQGGADIMLRVVERFREVDAEMQAQSMAVLLKVAKHPVPIKMGEIAQELGLSQSTISRNVAYLGDWNRHKEKGHQLLEAFEDPMERRRKLVRLTAKGKRFIKSLSEIIN
jgi:DNA-binding MarR family transcriptional regulator